MHSVGRTHSSIEAASGALHINISGLFHRAVSQSGTAFCSWALAPNGSSSHQTEKLAAQLGCPAQPSSALVSCLRTKDAVDITATDRAYMVSTSYMSFMSLPIHNIDT
jgi:carboxylesterase type B